MEAENSGGVMNASPTLERLVYHPDKSEPVRGGKPSGVLSEVHHLKSLPVGMGMGCVHWI